MPCFRAKEKPIPPLFYFWSASWLIPPTDHIKIDHCYKPVEKKNFIKKNRESLMDLQRKVTERNKSVVNKCSLAYKQTKARFNKSTTKYEDFPIIPTTSNSNTKKNNKTSKNLLKSHPNLTFAK